MKQNLRRGLFCLLALVFILSTGRFLWQLRDNANGSDSYAGALEIALQTPEAKPGATEVPTAQPTEAPAVPEWIPEPVEDANMETLAAIDLAALQQVNEDVVGWIWIPDTQIQYPLLQGEDNDYYLDHTWEGEKNSVGSIYLEYQNSPELTDFHTIVYGHNMKNGSMFAQLRQYAAQDFWQAHPCVYIVSAAGIFRYEIYSAYEAEVDSLTYGLGFPSTASMEKFLQHTLEESGIETGITPPVTDRILTLSTCSGMGYETRWVVHARLKMVESA